MNPQQMPDPDRDVFLRSARSIGLQVALLCLGMVIAGSMLVFGAVWWKAQIDTGQDPGRNYVVVAIDWVDLIVAATAVGIAAVILSGVAGMFFARRATRPLADALARQRNFVADASHELRTPLSVLHARIQHLIAVLGPEDRARPVALDLKQDSAELIAIVDDLLQLATVAPVVGEPVPLDPILARLAEEHGVLAHDREITLHVDQASATVLVPDVALHRALSALIDNALGHTPAGGFVDVSVAETARMVEVRVRDNGPGISGIEPSRVFERFAHGTGGSRTSHGIGLALVHDTITRCGGDVGVESTGPDGTTFLLQLPRG